MLTCDYPCRNKGISGKQNKIIGGLYILLTQILSYIRAIFQKPSSVGALSEETDVPTGRLSKYAFRYSIAFACSTSAVRCPSIANRWSLYTLIVRWTSARVDLVEGTCFPKNSKSCCISEVESTETYGLRSSKQQALSEKSVKYWQSIETRSDVSDSPAQSK